MEATKIGKRYAWPRFFAAGIDVVSIVIASVVLSSIFDILWESSTYQFFADVGDYAFSSLPGALLVGMAFFLLIAFLESRTGVTPGKLLCRIKVQDIYGKKLTFIASVLRNLYKFLILILLYIPVIAVILFIVISVIQAALGGSGVDHYNPQQNSFFTLVEFVVAFLLLLVPFAVLFKTINPRGQTWYDRGAHATITTIDATSDGSADAFSALESLQKLSELKKKGAITTAEFEEQKQKLLKKM